MTTNKLAELAQRKAKLANDYKVAVAALRDEAKEANIDPAALGRLVTYMRKDEQARLDQQAVDDQYRFLAGLRSAAAEIPPGGQLAMAAALYAKDMKVRAVADKMGISGVQCSAAREHERRTKKWRQWQRASGGTWGCSTTTKDGKATACGGRQFWKFRRSCDANVIGPPPERQPGALEGAPGSKMFSPRAEIEP
jgi:hypothetical protein